MGDTEQNTLNDLEIIAILPDQRDVVLSRRIEADISRVLYALSIPEYIEAWLEPPDVEELQFVFNPVAQEAFRIDLYRAEALQANVHGSCSVMNANQVRYTWKLLSPVGMTETSVDMQLLCCSGACILGLKHSGFKDMEESVWCCKMWHRSLESLCRLMESRKATYD
jgi:hypothetical protein